MLLAGLLTELLGGLLTVLTELLGACLAGWATCWPQIPSRHHLLTS